MKFVPFFFDIPYTKKPSSGHDATASQTLPSSILVQASKHLTNNTALSNRKAVQGSCHVSYQVEARFLRNDLTVFQTICPVELLSLPEPRSCLSSERPPKEFRSVARTAILRRPWRRGKGDLWISVLEPEPLIWRPGAWQGCHPVNLSIRLSLQQLPKVALESIECSVQARWEEITKFSVATERNRVSAASSANSLLALSKTVVLKSQNVQLLFPPWYQVAVGDGK
jgi:hypothetical protein